MSDIVLTEFSPQQMQQILDFSGIMVKCSQSKNKLIHSLFEEAVYLYPDKIAVIYYDENFSYGRINALANQIARHLQNSGLRPDTPVGLYLDRSPWLIISILAILKAGGAYVPLDPAYPEKRNRLILEDSKPALLITQKKHSQLFQKDFFKMLVIDEDVNIWGHYPEDNLNLSLKASSQAYNLYTSGTSGKPKGIAIEHSNTLGLLNWAVQEYSPRQITGVLGVTSVCFDLSIFEIFLPLISGNTLILVNDIVDIQLLQEQVKNQISLINTVPSAIGLLLDLDMIPPSVNSINLAGEILHRNVVDRLYEISTIDKIYNLYGPSETTTYASCALLNKLVRTSPTIGKPITGACIFILDNNLQPVPLGVPGEIYIGGFGVGRGYYNNSAQTNKKFTSISIFNQPSTRLFKTGDLAFFTEEGELHFLGRLDNQIKLRGFRIEPEEIESVLMSHPDIQQAVVLAQADEIAIHKLISFVCLQKHSNVTTAQILDYVKTLLPSYMLPSAIVAIDAMPLNENGKINRKRLDIENQLTIVWKNLLGHDTVTRNDNFFDLGGHSLLLIKMKIQLEELFQVKINKIELFKYPTIAELAKYIVQFNNEKNSDIKNYINEDDKNDFENNDIAVIGMSCRFPGDSTLEQFWDNLCNGVESIQDISEGEAIASNNVQRAAWLEDIEFFDKDFFNYTAKEAQILDPQQRLFLECAWEALENAGYAAEIHPERIGVFSTSEKSEYLENILQPYLDTQPEISSAEKFLIRISNDKDYLSTRTSYKLNLTGPSVNIQTACSSSLVAIHLARHSLLMGECDLALVGGVALHVPQKNGYIYQEGMITSPDGHCRAFDAKANGTVFGNGGGAVILKPYGKARLDNDFIYAVIKGSAINNDGIGKLGFTAPSVEGQAAVIKKALQDAKIKSDFISYVEAHGTGTPLGDLIEVTALTQAFAEREPSLPRCAIGSVKTNIGHLDGAAGIAGFIKTVLILKNKQLPPSLHFVSPNPDLNFDNSPLVVCHQLTPWPRGGLGYAGVSSFGIGGTNSHVILGESPRHLSLSPLTKIGQRFILPLSAKSQSGLKLLAQQYINFLENKQNEMNLQDVCYTAAVGRRHFSHRLAVTGSHFNEIINNLKNWLLGVGPPDSMVNAYIKNQQMDWRDFYKDLPCRRIPLPTYPFQRQRFWVEKPLFSILGKQMALPFAKQIRFENTFSVSQPAYNNHHRLFGIVVVPGSSHLAVFIAALNKQYPFAGYSLRDIIFLSPLVILEKEQCQVQVILDEELESIKMISAKDNVWQIIVEAQFQIHQNQLGNDSIDIQGIKNRCLLDMTGKEFYNHVWAPGIDTGNSFRWLKRIWYTINQEAIGYTYVPDFLDPITESLHPGLIETCFQLLNACCHFDTQENFIYVPFIIQELCFVKFADHPVMYSYARIREMNPKTHNIIADVCLLDKQGEIVLKILGFEVRKLYSKNLIQAGDHPDSPRPRFKHSQSQTILEKIIQSTHNRKAVLYDYMVYLMQKILGWDTQNNVIDYSRGFIDYGLDSLMSIELRNQLQIDLNLKLSTTFAFDYSTIDQVVFYLDKIFTEMLGEKDKSALMSDKIQDEYDQLELVLSGNKTE